MKKIFFVSLLAALCFTACSSDEEETSIKPTNDVESPNSTPRLMTVEISENPMVDENGERKVMRRGKEITTSSLSAFSMNYQANKYDFSKTGSTWSKNNWPVSEPDTKCDFYAYNDGIFNYDNGNPYINFTVEGTPAYQKDLLVATHKNISYNDAQGVVSLRFDHACAAVKFNICKTSGVGDKTVVIKSVTLNNVKNSGYYYYHDGLWGYIINTASYSLNESDITLTTELMSLLPENAPYLFIIPQSKSGVTLTVKYTVNSGSDQTYENTWSTGTWEAGIEYTINIKMGTSIIK